MRRRKKWGRSPIYLFFARQNDGSHLENLLPQKIGK
jgi:hypothetical protein